MHCQGAQRLFDIPQSEHIKKHIIVNPYNTEIFLYKPWKQKGFSI